MSIFRYPLRINSKKHPEVCARLEQAKEKDGIALYIRQLVERDLANEHVQQFQPLQQNVVAKPQLAKNEPAVKNTLTLDVENNAEDDDFGGGLA